VPYIKLVSFDAWSRFIQRPLIWLGRADPVRSVAISEEADPDRGGISEVLAAWHNTIGDEPFTLKPIPPNVAEMVIAHAQPGLHQIYDRHSYRDEKRRALELWAARLAEIVAPDGAPDNVVKLRTG
jgi:hypothetical protein